MHAEATLDASDKSREEVASTAEGTVKYGDTRYRITLVCHETRWIDSPSHRTDLRWIEPAQLDQYPMNVTSRRISRLIALRRCALLPPMQAAPTPVSHTGDKHAPTGLDTCSQSRSAFRAVDLSRPALLTPRNLVGLEYGYRRLPLHLR